MRKKLQSSAFYSSVYKIDKSGATYLFLWLFEVFKEIIRAEMKMALSNQ